MRQQIDQRKLWLQVIGVLLVIGLLLAWFIRSQTKPLNNIELGIEVADLHTYATAASLLTDLTLNNKSTQTYFETQTSLLRDKVEDEMKSLESARVDQGLEIKQWQARQLVARLKVAIEKLQSSFTRQQDLRNNKAELDSLVSPLKELEATLMQ